MRQFSLFLLLILGAAGLTAAAATSPDTPAPPDAPTPLETLSPEMLPFLPRAEWAENRDPAPAAPVSFPGNWSRLAYQSLSPGNWEIYEFKWVPYGGNRLTFHPAADVTPRYNRGADRIVFVSDRTGNLEIFSMRHDGGDVRRLTFTDAPEYGPTWSPDGQWIAFYSYRDGQAEVYKMRADGSQQQRLTYHGGWDGNPAWSPDGTQLAFASDRNGNPRIFVMNASGGSATQLSHQSFSYDPVWSPDGRHIAYDADGDNDGWPELWVMDAGGANQRQLLDAGSPASDVMTVAGGWSPDGESVLFTNIYLVYYQGNWYWTAADIGYYELAYGSYHYLGSDDLAWNLTANTSDALPPRTWIDPLPDVWRNDAPLPLAWGGGDGPAGSGPLGDRASGIASFDVAVAEDDGPPTIWREGTTETTADFPAVSGHTYTFQSRAIDHAFNQGAWSVPRADTRITVYDWAVRGAVVDNGGAPVVDADCVTVPAAFTGGTSAGDGAFTALVAGDHSTYQVTCGKSVYGALPATAYDGARDAEPFYVLPPADDVLLNGNLEDGLSGPGWVVSGTVPVSETETALTGAVAAQLGTAPALTDPAAIPVGIDVDGYDSGVDAQGTLHVVAVAGSDAYYMQRPPGGGWSTPELIADNASWADLQVEIGPGGEVHFTWETIWDLFHMWRAVDGTWSAPFEISGSPQVLRFEQAIAPDGTLHTVWRYPDDYIYYRQRDPDGNWGATENTFLTENYYVPIPFADGQGRFHLIWRTNNTFSHQYRSPSGAWSSPEYLPWFGTYPHWSDLRYLVDEDGQVHAIWFAQQGGDNILNYAVRDTNGDWELELPYVADGYLNNGQLLLEEDGTVHLTWEDHYEIFHTRRSPGGLWTPVEPLDTTSFATTPQVAVDPAGDLHVVWQGDAWDLFYRRQDAGTWLPTQHLAPGNSNALFMQLRLTSAGQVHFLYPTRDDLQPIDLMYSTAPTVTEDGMGLLSQTTTVPQETSLLSFAYRLNGTGGGGGLRVTVEDGAGVTTVYSTTTATDWRQAWVDFSPWAGQSVTVTVGLDQVAGQPAPWATVDDVSLGSAAPDSFVKVAGTSRVLVGDEVSYVVRYGNHGGVEATAAWLTVTLPAEVSFVAADVAPDVIQGQMVAWNVGDLPAGMSPSTITITGTVTTAASVNAPLTLVAELNADQAELEGANNLVNFTTTYNRPLFLPLIRRH